MGLSEGLSRGLPEGCPRIRPVGLSEGLSRGLPKGYPRIHPVGLSEGLSQGLPKGCPKFRPGADEGIHPHGWEVVNPSYGDLHCRSSLTLLPLRYDLVTKKIKPCMQSP